MPGLPNLNPTGGPPPGPGAGAIALGRLPSPYSISSPTLPQSGGVLQQLASLYGATSPQEALQQRNRGVQPQLTAQPNPAPQQGLPPQQAGVVQSEMPGMQNGNDANGYHDPMGAASAQMMRSLPPMPPGGGGLPPMPGAHGMPGMPGQMPQPVMDPNAPFDPRDYISQMATQLGLPQVQFDEPMDVGLPPGVESLSSPMGMPEPMPQLQPQPVEAQDAGVGVGGLPATAEQPIRSASMQPVDPNVQNDYAIADNPSANAISQERAQSNEPPPPGQAMAMPEPGRGNFSNMGINTPDGYKPWNEAGWNSINNNVEQGQKGDARVSYIENSGGAWIGNFWDKAFGPGGVTGSTRDLPDPAGLNYGITIEGTDLPDSIWGRVNNTGVQDLLRKWEGWATKVSQLEQEDGSDKDRGRIQEINEKLRVAEAALAQYGITATPQGEFPDTTGGPDDIYGDDATQAEGDPYTLRDPDLTIEPKIVTQLFGPRSGRTPQENAAAAEMAGQIIADQTQRQNQQLGVNELVRSRDQFTDDPLYQQIRDQAAAIGAQDNYDYTGIRNQAVADQNQSFNTAIQNLGASAASRGLPTASMSGLQGELALDNASTLARFLGDINMREQQTARDFALQGLGASQAAFGSTAGPLAQLNQQIASALGAPVGTIFNPAGGALDASGGLLSLDRAEDQLDLAKDSARFDKYAAGADAGMSLLSLLGFV